MEQWEKHRVDGCAVFWRTSRFNFINEYGVEFASLTMHRSVEFPDQESLSRLMTKDNVALGVMLEVLPPQRSGRRHIFISNSHIHWNPSFSDVKLMQAQLLLESCEAVIGRAAPRFPGVPMILAGDFNSMPSSGVYSFLRDGRLSSDHPEFLNYHYGKYSSPGSPGLRHNFRLASTYASTGAEPSFTNYTSEFVGTLDYIWYTHDTLMVTAVASPIDVATAKARVALPSPHFPSDHISLVAEYCLK